MGWPSIFDPNQSGDRRVLLYRCRLLDQRGRPLDSATAEHPNSGDAVRWALERLERRPDAFGMELWTGEHRLFARMLPETPLEE